jgi:hemerythrin superfamily protein
MPQSRAPSLDAIAMLTQDHSDVGAMFDKYATLGDKARSAKQTLATEICKALTVHATVEEELFYPAVREAIDDMDLMDEADVEHAGAKDLIAQIEAMKPGDSHYDAKVKVLGEEIRHHVKEEQGKMFPKVKKSGLDTKELGARIAARKKELQRVLDEHQKVST